MKKIQKRFLAFLIGCIGVRFLLAWTAKTINKKYLPIISDIIEENSLDQKIELLLL